MHWFLLVGAFIAAGVWAVLALMHARGRSVTLRGEGVTPVLLAVLLSGGALHTAPPFDRLPIDLVLLLLAAIGLAAGNRLLWCLRNGHLSVAPTLAVGAILVLGLFAGLDSDYRDVKVRNLVVTVAVVFATTLLLHSSERRVRFLQGTIGVGVLALMISRYAPSTDVALGRLSAEGATTSATGRMAGAAVVVLVAWVATRQLNTAAGLVGAATLSALMVATGSRGPLAAAGVAAVIVLLAAFGRRPLRTAVVSVGLGLAGWWAWGQASGVAQSRINQALSSDRGASVSQREFMWARSYDIVQHQFWGSGWGSLSGGQLVVDKYPHDIVLEVWVEAGWLAAGVLVGVLVAGAVRAARAGRIDPTAVPLLALLVFWVANALVSGDVTDNRGVFVLMAACLTLPGRRPGSEPLDDLDVPGATSTAGTGRVAVGGRTSTATACTVAARAANSASARGV